MFPFLQPFLNHRRDADYTEPTQLVKDAKKAADAAEEAAKEAEKQYNVANTAAKSKPFPSHARAQTPGMGSPAGL